MGEKANLIEAPAAAPGLLDQAGSAAGGAAMSLGSAAAAGVTGAVTSEVSHEVRSRVDEAKKDDGPAAGGDGSAPEAEGKHS